VVGLLRVLQPPLRQQEQLAQTLDDELSRVRRLSKLLQDQILLLQEHRQTLITAAVTGQLDIPGVAA
jgi:type I restriction enzyme, S subunit